MGTRRTHESRPGANEPSGRLAARAGDSPVPHHFELRANAPGPARLVVVGPIDHVTATEFRTVAERAVGTRAVVIDLEACTDLDSSGLGALIRSVRRIHEAGGRVVVTTSARTPLALRLRHAGMTRLAPVIAKETTGRAA